MDECRSIADESAQRCEAWSRAERLGIDMTLVEANLRLTPAERLRQHARALNTAVKLREAMEAAHARSRLDS